MNGALLPPPDISFGHPLRSLWARLSAQVYNELSDYEALAPVFG